ncbi:MAG: cellulose synthase operon protein YhjQ/BcsQ [Rhodopila sp.]
MFPARGQAKQQEAKVAVGHSNVVRIAEAQEIATSLEIGRGVMALVDDDVTAAALRAGLAVLGDDFELERGNIFSAIRKFQKEVPSQALIVDISGVDNPQAALDDLARVCPPDVQVFVAGDNTDISFYRLLVQDLGITEYLTKPVTRDAVLRLVLPRLNGATAEQTDPRGGQIVAVCGARGGVGTSSIALNLAYEIMTSVKGHVALLDLHVQGGEIALMVGARPGPGLRIALEDATRVDGLFLERASIVLEPRLRLIASEEAFDTEATVTEAGLARVLDLLQKKFNFIIVDIPMPLPPALIRVVTLARQVVTVLTPDVASLRDTQNIRNVVAGITGADRVISVLNRADMKGGIERALIDRALGGAPDVIIPELGRGMLEAINRGVPAVKRVPGLRRYLAPLVREIAGVRPSLGDSWLRRMFGR